VAHPNKRLRHKAVKCRNKVAGVDLAAAADANAIVIARADADVQAAAAVADNSNIYIIY
jgi:hypothetical protein